MSYAEAEYQVRQRCEFNALKVALEEHKQAIEEDLASLRKEAVLVQDTIGRVPAEKQQDITSFAGELFVAERLLARLNLESTHAQIPGRHADRSIHNA